MKGCLCSSTEGRFGGSRHAPKPVGLVMLGLMTLGVFTAITPASAQMTVEKEVIALHGSHNTANYELAARFAPYKIRSMVKEQGTFGASIHRREAISQVK